jgi:hypothetical protein
VNRLPAPPVMPVEGVSSMPWGQRSGAVGLQ